MSVDISYKNNIYLDKSTSGESSRVATFVIPYWVDAAIQRNRLNYMSLKDMATLGQYVSLSDMAEVLALSGSTRNELLQSKAPLLYRLSYFGAERIWFDDGGYDRPIYKLASMQNTHLDVLDRLSDPVPSGNCCQAEDIPVLDETNPVMDPVQPEQELYKIVVVDHNTVVVVLQKGILNKLGDKEYSKGFLSAYLRALYSIESVDKVSEEPAFYEYVSRL